MTWRSEREYHDHIRPSLFLRPAFVRSIATAGLRMAEQNRKRARGYWIVRRRYVERCLRTAGWHELLIEAELVDLEAAVRTEARRLGAAALPDGSNQPNDEAAA